MINTPPAERQGVILLLLVQLCVLTFLSHYGIMIPLKWSEKGSMNKAPNAQQQRVIEDLENNIILFAGAGTGKTFTVANRVGNIIQTGKARPEEILCLTFTTKACDEMREDIFRYVGELSQRVEIRTIHGFCYQFMREENRRNNDRYSEATICDEMDAEELLQSILSSQYLLWKSGKTAKMEEVEEELPETTFEIFTKKNGLRNFVSAVKHAREEQNFYSDSEEVDYQNAFAYIRATKPKQYEEILSFYSGGGGQVRDYEFEKGMTKHAGRWISTYDGYLRMSNRVDFDDLIIFTSRALKDEETQRRWQQRFAYIIVDEMQDTSLLEYSVLTRIFGKSKLMMCGDFFQSIYEWRGSKPSYVLKDFIERYSAKMYMFSENYRSTKVLTEATFGYLRNTYPDLVGRYCPDEVRIHSETDGDKILCIGFDNRREEGVQIYRYVKKLTAQSEDSVCIMARSNNYIAALKRVFDEENRKYPLEEYQHFFTAEENLQFYKKPLVKDVMAMIRLLLNRADRVSMERITQKYVRLVGVKTIEQLRLQNRIGASIVSYLDKQVYTHGDPYHVLIESLKNDNIVIYDTETTGLDLTKDEMVQLSAIRLNRRGEIIDTFDQMILPTVEIGRGAYETHGFDLEYIKAHGGVSAEEALKAFSAFVKGSVLVGHNSFRFDAPLINRQLLENGLPSLEVLAEYDTMVMAKELHAELPNFKLSTLCDHYGIVNEAAHNAYGDIVATGKALFAMLTEDIQPTSLERKNVCEKYRDKFEKLYLFLQELTADMESNDVFGLVTKIVDGLKLKKHYSTEADARLIGELLATFRTVKAHNAELFLREFVMNVDLLGNKNLFAAKRKAIPMMTVHQAKGCEFDVVIIAGVDEKNFPNFFAQGEATEEEEKKVFYVAITRAKKRLVLTRAAYNGRSTVSASPYVEKIPERCTYKNERWYGVND